METKDTAADSTAVPNLIQASLIELKKMRQEINETVLTKMLQATLDHKINTLEFLPPVIRRFNDQTLVHYLWCLIHCQSFKRRHVLVLMPSMYMGSCIFKQLVKLLSEPMGDLILANTDKRICFKDQTADPMTKREHLHRDQYSSFQLMSITQPPPKGHRADVVVAYDASRQEVAKFTGWASGYHIPLLVLCLWSGGRNIEFDQVIADERHLDTEEAVGKAVKT